MIEVRTKSIAYEAQGIHSIELRVGHTIASGAPRTEGKDLYWRMPHFALPSHSTTPSTLPGESHFGYTFVPIDDENI